jgi:hypothetical protein
MKTYHLDIISARESCSIVGGADKNAQNALYYIGYAIGFLVNCIVRLFSAKEPQAEPAVL